MIKKSIILSLISLFTYLISLISQLNIAYSFGTSRQLDIFFIASSIPILIGALISNAMSYSLIPHLLNNKFTNPINYISYIRNFLLKSMFLFLCFSVFFLLLYYLVTPYVYKSYSNSELNLIKIISFIFFLNMLLSLINGILISIINANEKYSIAMLSNIFPYLFSIISVILLNDILGIKSLAIGNLFGTLASTLLLLSISPKEIFQFKYESEFNLDIFNFYKKMVYAIIAMLCFTFFQSSDGYWTSDLGSSKMSYISYCQRLLVAIGSIIIIGPSTIFIPKLTNLYNKTDKLDFYNSIIDILILLIAFSTIIVSLILKYSNEIIKIIFYRGNFTLKDVSSLSLILPYMLIGMIFMICVVVLFRILFIANLQKFAASIGFTCALLYFILSGLLSNVFDINGISYAYLITWFIVFIITIFLLFKSNLKLLLNKRIAFFLFFQLFFLIVLNFIIYKISIIDSSNFLIILKIILIGLITFFVYFILTTFILKIKPIDKFFFLLIPKILTKEKINFEL